MKQRVIVQAIVQSDGRTLLLRRSQGRSGLIGKYELPGGSIEDSEQPDDALHRHLLNSVGIREVKLVLRDVVSINNREEGDIQHIFIVYTVEHTGDNQAITLGSSYNSFQWVTMSEVQQYALRDSAQHLLGLYSEENTESHDVKNKSLYVAKKSTSQHVDHIIIYSDGGSRGNPGPSAAAFVIVNDIQEVIAQGGEYLGITTNNQAEYHGVRLGLERAIELGLKSVEFRIDSMLVVNQLKTIYKIKNRELWPINERIVTLLPEFNYVKFVHVPRELNKLADGLVNKLLDEHQNDQP